MGLLIVTFEVRALTYLSNLKWVATGQKALEPIYRDFTGASVMADKDPNYSWKGSPNAGKVLMIGAALFGLLIILAGFSG